MTVSHILHRALLCDRYLLPELQELESQAVVIPQVHSAVSGEQLSFTFVNWAPGIPCDNLTEPWWEKTFGLCVRQLLSVSPLFLLLQCFFYFHVCVWCAYVYIYLYVWAHVCVCARGVYAPRNLDVRNHPPLLLHLIIHWGRVFNQTQSTSMWRV